MDKKSTFKRIDTLIRREVVPATGCTEPACITLTVAYAAKLLPASITKIKVLLSANMLKNAMGVGIPGTGMIGIPIAIALGAVLKAPEHSLELLNKFTDAELEEAKKMTKTDVISVKLKGGEGIDKLYSEAICYDEEGNQARAIIQGTHTGLDLLELNGVSQNYETLEEVEACPMQGLCDEKIETNNQGEDDIRLSFDLVYDYATQANMSCLDFIYEAGLQNNEVANYALEHKHGHNLGQLIASESGAKLFGSNPLTNMISYTSAACDARMDGASMTVMSNSGSGNQGITATLPVLKFAESQGASREETTRALMMSSLMVVYIKQMLGRLSSLCGMVVSGIGSSAAIVYLMGGSREQSAYAVHNMVGNVTGMICDGAKPSCSLKASTGVSSALVSALLAMNDERVGSLEGVVAESVDESLRNLATIGSDGMRETDQKILHLMTNKAN